MTEGKYNSDMHFEVTGEFRPPKKGEYYLPAVTLAHQAIGDMLTPYWIARPIKKRAKRKKKEETND